MYVSLCQVRNETNALFSLLLYFHFVLPVYDGSPKAETTDCRVCRIYTNWHCAHLKIGSFIKKYKKIPKTTLIETKLVKLSNDLCIWKKD
jgi:hypothetical protein